jgi:hypothetical protein
MISPPVVVDAAALAAVGSAQQMPHYSSTYFLLQSIAKNFFNVP